MGLYDKQVENIEITERNKGDLKRGRGGVRRKEDQYPLVTRSLIVVRRDLSQRTRAAGKFLVTCTPPYFVVLLLSSGLVPGQKVSLVARMRGE